TPAPRTSHDAAGKVARAPAESFRLGDPFGDSTMLGPVVSQPQFDKIQRLIQAGLDEGAAVAIGGTGRPDGLSRGYYVKPTVFGGVRNDMTIAREEIFGPVLSILPYDREEEAVEIANDTLYGLSGYVLSANPHPPRPAPNHPPPPHSHPTP